MRDIQMYTNVGVYFVEIYDFAIYLFFFYFNGNPNPNRKSETC